MDDMTNEGPSAAIAPATQRVRGIDRVVAIFEYLHECRRPRRVSAIARAIEAPRSTTYDVINRLLEARILEVRDDGAIFFGPAMHFYGTDYISGTDWMRVADREVKELAEKWGETAQFCALDGNKYAILLTGLGSRTFKISSDIGVRVSIPWTASGRLLLGGMTPEEILDFVPSEDFRLADGKMLDRQRFLNEVDAAHRQGYCITQGLIDNFSMCMAAPVKRKDGRIIGTICFVVTKDTSHERRDKLLAALVESGARLSQDFP
jgi:DNA-binding IclR family transcriptional regulator